MKLLRPKEAAALLGVSPNTLRRMDLPHYVVSPRGDRRYDQAQLEQWLREAYVQTADTAPTSLTQRSSVLARAVISAAPSFVVRKVE